MFVDVQHTLSGDDVPVKKGLVRMSQWIGEVHMIDPKNPDDYILV